LGILGLAALVWLLIRFYIFVVQVESAGLNKQELPLFRAAWLGATITFVHGLTDAPQFSGSGFTLPLLLGVLGIAVVLGRSVFEQEENEQTNVTPTPFYRHWGWLLAAGLIIVGVVIFWRPLLSAWYANLGALQQTRAELSPDWSDSTREAATKAAIGDFSSALAVNPAQPAANRRLGLMALEREKFEPAIQYLEQAYLRQPGNQATLKALGYAYLWSGQLDRAELPLRRLDDRGNLIEDLRAWSFWWASQNRPTLAESTDEMIDRLSAEP
jgi:tetratricopeptide (TPR) repeat protein